jgi:hypothetical protein
MQSQSNTKAVALQRVPIRFKNMTKLNINTSLGLLETCLMVSICQKRIQLLKRRYREKTKLPQYIKEAEEASQLLSRVYISSSIWIDLLKTRINITCSKQA